MSDLLDLSIEDLKKEALMNFGIYYDNDNTIVPQPGSATPRRKISLDTPIPIPKNEKPPELVHDDSVDIQKEDIIIPKGVRYVGEMNANGKIVYELKNYPYHHILNKVLTGCGFTEYCINNEQDLILCSPRKMLLENKQKQHPEFNVFYAKNDNEITIDYERGFSLSDSKKSLRKYRSFIQSIIDELNAADSKVLEEKRARIMEFKEKIKLHYLACKSQNAPCKILVTYDSFRHVKEALKEIGVLEDFQVVIDEFQSILVDCKFKADTEMELLYQLADINKVCFVSATPMLDKYIRRLDEFKDLPYLEFDWHTEDPGRIIKPNLKVYKTSNVTGDVAKIIGSYLKGEFEKESKINDQGMIEEVISNEAVLYVNSVKHICTAITKCCLLPDQCNILIARTSENNDKIRKAFNEVYKKLKIGKKLGTKENLIGEVPTKGQQHKMFTFCTRTVYLGADFYSTCARSFIVSDANIDSLTVDVAMDLPQILGRQRLDENPWKTRATIYIKTNLAKLTRKDFDKFLEKKVNSTKCLLNVFIESRFEYRHDLANKYLKDAVGTCYRDDYVSVNRHAFKDLAPDFNNIMLVAEERAFDIQQMDYADRVSIFNTLHDKGFATIEINNELETFNSINFYHDKMRYLCDQNLVLPKDKFDMLLNSVPMSFKNYYITLGPDRCKALMYQKGNMEKEYQRLFNNQGISLDDKVYLEFHEGDKLTKADIKSRLANIYAAAGYKGSVAAVDISRWFITKSTMFTNRITKKREAGFELLSRKLPMASLTPPPPSNP